MMRVEIQANKQEKNLAEIEARVRQAIRKGLMALALDMQNNARKSILKGGKTGEAYGRGGKFKRGKNAGKYRKYHQASAPGQPPANDTGFLANAIIAGEVNETTVELRSLAPYSLCLEYGTVKMAARPFMRPAAWVTSLKADKVMAAYAEKATRKFSE